MKLSTASTVTMGIAMALATGCNDATAPVAPPGATPTPTSPAVGGSGFPTLTHPGSVYVEEAAVYQAYYGQAGPIISRYVLYDDGTFSLQFANGSRGSFEYQGTYSISFNVVKFAFADRDSAGPWNATADIVGDELSVTYNDTMGMADFVNGKYRQSPTSP